MKKVLLILFILAVGLGVQAQKSAIFGATASSTINGAAAVNIELPQKLFQEYDYSYQVIPALAGAGDSLNAAVALYQANDLDGTTWTEITSARDTVTATAGKLIEGTDAKGLRHRLTITGISTDTMTVSVDWILKLEKQW